METPDRSFLLQSLVKLYSPLSFEEFPKSVIGHCYFHYLRCIYRDPIRYFGKDTEPTVRHYKI
jgi:hypothetical protein